MADRIRVGIVGATVTQRGSGIGPRQVLAGKSKEPLAPMPIPIERSSTTSRPVRVNQA